MKPVESEVKTYFVNMQCDCGGYLMFTGKAKPAIEQGKVNFIHICSNCKKLEDLKEQYPQKKYKPYTDLNA